MASRCRILYWMLTLVFLTVGDTIDVDVEIFVHCDNCANNGIMIPEGDAVSILCKISRKLDSSETIFIEQNNKDNKNIKWMRDGSLIIPNTDNNPFTGGPTYNVDGSVLYIMTFTSANRSHAGQYVCTVFNNWQFTPNILGFDSKDIDIIYLPNASFPFCQSNRSLHLVIGEVVELTCLSEVGNPPISLTWTRENNSTVTQNVSSINGTVRNLAVLVASVENNGTMFTCFLESPLVGMIPDLTSLQGTSKSNCSIGPLFVTEPLHTGDNRGTKNYRPILGIPFTVFVISATGLGTFLLLSLILIIIFACYSYRCDCMFAKKNFSISGPGGRHGRYNIRAHGSDRGPKEVWTPKRPSRVAPPPPNGKRGTVNLTSISELPNGQDIAMNSYLGGSTDRYPSPPSYPDDPVTTFPPPPEEWLQPDPDEAHYHTASDIEDRYQPPGNTSDTGNLLDAPDGLSYDSEWSEDPMDDDDGPYGIINPAFEEETIYQNSPNIIPNEHDQDQSFNIQNGSIPLPDYNQSENNTDSFETHLDSNSEDINIHGDSINPDEDLNTLPIDDTVLSLKYRGSETLPRNQKIQRPGFPEYAKPFKIKHKRTNSLPSRKNTTKPSRPTFQPPPPPTVPSLTTHDVDDVKPSRVNVRIGSIDATGYAKVTH